MIFSRPPDRRYLELFAEGADNAARAAKLLRDMIEACPEWGDLPREILICEQAGDRVTQDIIVRLNGGNKPPFNEAQVHLLATTLDDVVDFTEQVSDSFNLYGIEASMEQAFSLASVLVDAVAELQQALRAVQDDRSPADHLIAVHRLENDGDRLSREAIAALFAGGIDPMVVIRWKDIFEQLEHAIDACESVAHVLESATLVKV